MRDGCPSYYKESDYKFFLAVEALERAAMTIDAKDKENLAREAFNSLSKVPESVDLRTVCKRFEDLRYIFFSFLALLHFHDEHHLFFMAYDFKPSI